MTEKEKAALGLLYNNNYDKELIEERLDCQTMCHEYNQLPPREMGKRQQLIRQILGDIGDGFQIEQPFHCDFGYNIHIGKNFYANYNFVVLDEAPVTGSMYLSLLTVDFILPDILSMPRREMKGWNMLNQLPSAIMCGSEAV